MVLALTLESKGMNLRTIGALLSAVVFSSACVPLPHSVTLTPEISGRVVASGNPAPNATLSLTNSYRQDPCAEASPVGSTGPEGNFRLEEERQFCTFYAPLVAPVSIVVFALRINDGEKSVLGYRGVTTYDQRTPVQLNCDLRQPYLLKGGDGFQGQAVCR